MKEKIIEACIFQFNEKGCKFTVDDIVEMLKISKKTFYKYFSSKEQVLIELIRQIHDKIQEVQKIIYEDQSLNSKEKLYKSLTIEALHENDINLTKVYTIKQFFPDVYDYFMKAYSDGWDYTIKIINDGIKENLFIDCNINLVINLLIKSMTMLWEKDILTDSKITYKKALNDIVSIIIEGISVK